MVRRWSPVGGFSLLEVLVATALIILVSHGLWTVLVRHREAGVRVGARAEGLEAVRTLAWLLPEEVSGGRVGVDWQAWGGDSLRLRAYRGVGLVDPSFTGTREIRVCYRGIREPVPEKDSVLVLGRDGRWRASDLAGRRGGVGGGMGGEPGCAGITEGSLESWTLVPRPQSAVLVRVFEAGSYHVSGGALRYRRGMGGRQPLTAERFLEGRFSGPESVGGSLSWEVLLKEVPTPHGRNPGGPASVWRGAGW